MAPHLGKRKRITREELEEPSRSPTPDSGSESSESDGEKADLQEIFRRAFEAKFKPLEVEKKKRKVEEAPEELEDEEESDWSGISDEDEEGEPKVEVVDVSIPKVEVVDVSIPKAKVEKMSKAEMRAFMSSKPPTIGTTAPKPPPSKSSSSKDDDDPLEASHLKNDAELQRLLRDSHLLAANAKSLSNPSLTLTGSLRHKSTDLQLQALGAKGSIHAQKKMPMSHRKGMIAKAQEREAKRRAEAKEAGIVLERETRKKKGADRGRERGVGGPSVGKFRGGMLTLSKKDVRDITGEGGGERGKGKAKRGRR